MKLEDKRAARLLGGEDVPSVVEEESVFARVIADVSVSPTPWYQRLWRPLPIAAAVTAAAALLFVALPKNDEFAPRGKASEYIVDVVCRPGPACRQGQHLLFRVSGGKLKSGYVAAFARRPDGKVIWYFPQSEIADSQAFVGGQWIARSIDIGEEHVPGNYQIELFVTDEPLNRAKIQNLATGSAIPDSVVRIEHRITFEP